MKIYFIIFFVLPLSILAQETETVIKHNTTLFDDKITEYSVLKENKKIKHGDYVSYIKYATCIRLIESGSYNMGVKEGLWQTYSGIIQYGNSPNRNVNCLEEKGVYINGKKNGLWTRYYPDSSSTDMSLNKLDCTSVKGYSFVIRQQHLPIKSKCLYENDKRIGTLESYNPEGKISQIYRFSDSSLVFDETLSNKDSNNLQREPVFIGGVSGLQQLLNDSIDTESFYSSFSDSARINVGFTILPDGSVTNPTILKEYSFNVSNAFRKACIKSIFLTNKNWAPALKNGKPVNSYYRIVFSAYKANHNFRIWYVCHPTSS